MRLDLPVWLIRLADDPFAAVGEWAGPMCHVTTRVRKPDGDAPFYVDELVVGVAVEGLAWMFAVQRLIVLNLQALVHAMLAIHGRGCDGNVAVAARGAIRR